MNTPVNWRHTLARMIALAIIYYGAARLGLLLAFAGSNASPVWPPSGIAFAALLLGGTRLAPGIFFGALLANIAVFTANNAASTESTLLVSLVIAFGNTLEGALGASLMRRYVDQGAPFASISHVYRFVGITAAAGAVSALIGTAALLMSGIVPVVAGWTVFGTWWLGDVVGILVIAPVVLSWRKGSAPLQAHTPSLEVLASLIVLGAVLYAIFAHPFGPGAADRWIAYLLLLGVGWASYRHGFRGATLTCLITAAAAIAGTIQGAGPFATGTLNDSLFSIQTFVALCSLLGLILCADMSEVRARTSQGSLAQRLLAHWVTLFVCLGMTVAVWHLVSAATEVRAHERFSASAASINQRISERMHVYEQGLRSAAALFRASQSVERTEWHEFIEGMELAKNYAGIQGIGFAPVVASNERGKVEASVRADGFPAYTIWPATLASRSVPIIFLEPFTKQNQRAFGFDLLTEARRRAAILQAERSGATALTARLTLLQESQAAPQSGFLMFVPVFRYGDPAPGAETGNASLKGLVYSPFRMNDLMSGILFESMHEVSLEVFDGAAPSLAERMYASSVRSAKESQAYPNPFVIVSKVELQQHQWTVRVTSLAAFEDSIDRQKAQIVLVAGTVISLLFFWVIRASTAREEVAAVRAERMEDAFNESERKFESLVNSASEFAIIATDLDGIIRVFSQGAQRMLGYHAADMIGKTRLDLFHLPHELAERSTELAQQGLDAHAFQVLTAAVQQDGSDQREWTYVRADGTQLPVSLVMTAISNASGMIVGYLGVAHDIARQQELKTSLTLAKELAEAASRAKSDFVANMSHEIRTPMNAVLGLSHLLGKTALMPEQQEYLAMIRASGQSLLGIINDVLDFSKIEAGRMELESVAFDLDTVLSACAALMAANVSDPPLEVAIAAQKSVPRALIGDAIRLQQVLSNLVGNAIKFTQQGEVTLFVEVVEQLASRCTLRFIVSDTGIGMSEAQRGALFTAFTQADASMTRRFGGTGLGLTISRRLAEIMGGTIDVDSTEGVGSRFTLTLTFPIADTAGAGRISSLAALHFLLVESNAASRRAIDETIQGCGGTCDAFENAEQALAWLGGGKSGGARYGGLIVDSQLSGVALTDFVAKVRQGVDLPRLPCLQTVVRGKQAVAIGSALQHCRTLVKPVTGSALAVAIDALTLPARDHAGKAPAKPATPPARDFIGMRVLLVEDNELNQVVAKGLLVADGAEVVIAGNGEEAIAILSHDRHFDIVLMDVQMPVLDGLAATRQARAKLGLTLPIVAMSAGVLLSEREKCIAAGMDDFVPKPLDPRVMKETIIRHTRLGPPAAPIATAAPPPGNGKFDMRSLMAINAKNPGRSEQLYALVARSLESAFVQFDEARAAFLNGQISVATRALHGLRGALGNFGATEFSELSLELEAALNDEQDGQIVEQLFDDAHAVLAETVNDGQAWLARQRGTAVTEPSRDM